MDRHHLVRRRRCGQPAARRGPQAHRRNQTSGVPHRSPLAWTVRVDGWISLAVYLPVAATFAALLAVLTGLSVRTCTAIGLGIGCVLALASLALSMAVSDCRGGWHVFVRPGLAR